MRRTVPDQQENCYQRQQWGCFSAKKLQLVLSKQSCGSDTVASGPTLTILLVALTQLALYADNISKDMWSERPWWGQGQASINSPLFIVYICVNIRLGVSSPRVVENLSVLMLAFKGTMEFSYKMNGSCQKKWVSLCLTYGRMISDKMSILKFANKKYFMQCNAT